MSSDSQGLGSKTEFSRSDGGSTPVYVHEVFSAIQGEGRFVGARQVFVRLSGCNIRCAYCDEPDALEKKPGTARIEVTPGRRDFESVESPMPVCNVIAAVERLNSRLAHGVVSITGGEPLLQPTALAALLPALRSAGMRVALETNATRLDALEQVMTAGDIVSADLKLTSVDGEDVDRGLQLEFIRSALERGGEVYCKAVIGAATSIEEVAVVAADLGELDASMTLFLQPVTPFGEVARAPTPAQVLELQESALAVLADVRVVPQTHRFLGQL